MSMENRKSKFAFLREFSMVNWWVTWVAIIFLAYSNYDMKSYIKTELAESVKVLKKESRGVVMLDLLGRPIVAKKTLVNMTSEEVKTAIKRNIETYFIFDAVSLSGNFKNPIHSIEDLEKYNPKFPEFRDNFLYMKDKIVHKDFMSFEKYIVSAFGSDLMPEMVTLNKSEILGYTVNNGIFTIKISFDLYASVYDTNKGAYERRKSNIVSEFEGSLVPESGNEINALGIKYTSLKPAILTKQKR